MSQEKILICPHNIHDFLVIFNSDKSKNVMCKECYENPDIMYTDAAQNVWNFKTGEKLQ